jgi:hypothetical protein
LTLYALFGGQLGIGITLATGLAAVLAFGIEGTGTALSLAVSQLRRMEEVEHLQAGESDVPPAAPPPKPQLAQRSPAPREADTLVRQASALPEGSELRR